MFQIRGDPSYLCQKFGAFVADRARRMPVGLFWQMVPRPISTRRAPFLRLCADEDQYAIDRFAMEVKQRIVVLDRRLAESEYIAGADHNDRRHCDLMALVRSGPGTDLNRTAAAGRTTRRAPSE